MPAYPKVCSRCGKKYPISKFWKFKNSEIDSICRYCVTKGIDVNNPQTFIPVMKHYDIPFLPWVWKAAISTTMVPRKGSKQPYLKTWKETNGTKVFGEYFKVMKLNKFYKEQRFEDTEMLEKDKETNRAPEYKHWLKLTDLELDKYIKPPDAPVNATEALNQLTEHQQLKKVQSLQERGNLREQREKEIQDNLSEEDKKYLINKWGYDYQPSEWLQMEQMYNRYTSEYNMNVDREETLRSICKTSLKMNQAIDEGDPNAAKSYASMIDQLRKSAKFTEAQRDGKNDHKQLDTIGELVKLAENDGGIIEQLDKDPYDVPQDKLDFAIKDIQNYLYNLVTKEAGLGNLIESYVKKLDRKEEIEEMEMKQGAAIDEKKNTEEEVMDEAEQLLEDYGGDDES